MKLIVDARVLSSRPCGIGMYAFRYINELRKNPEIELTLLTDVIVSQEIKALENAGVPIVAYGKAIFRSAAVFEYFRFVAKELRERQPDVFWEPNCLLPMGLPGYKGKLVVTIYDMFPLTMPDCFGWKYRMYFKHGVGQTVHRANLICYDSVEAQESTEAFFPEAKKKKSFVCYPIVDRGRKDKCGEDAGKAVSGNTQKEEAVPYFYYIGNVERRKGIDILLKAYELYRAEGGQKGLKIAGGLKDECLKEQLEQMKSVEGFSYLGYVSDDEKRELFRHCDTFVFPSRGEGFGIPILEAMSAGKPVIASRLSVFEEIIGDCIRFFDMEGTADQQAAALCRAMRDEVRADLGAYEQVLGRYEKWKLGAAYAEQLKSL